MPLIVFIGIGLTAATVLIHSIGTVLWIQHVQRKYATSGQAESPQSEQDKSNHSQGTILWTLCVATITVALLHVAEVSLWAVAYQFIPNIDNLATFEEAFYFSMVTFTSLGYGDIVIGNSWRILCGLEAMAGTLVFGWSSALLLTLFLRMTNIAQPRDH